MSFDFLGLQFRLSIRKKYSPQSHLKQDLLRHLKVRFHFWEVEKLRGVFSELREGLTDDDFHELIDDLARDMTNYGRVGNWKDQSQKS